MPDISNFGILFLHLAILTHGNKIELKGYLAVAAMTRKNGIIEGGQLK